MAISNRSEVRGHQLPQECGGAALLHQAAALATGNGDLLAPVGLLDWKSWVGKQSPQAKGPALPSPADLLSGTGEFSQQHRGHRQAQSRGAKL
jgi:hypothetical protein